MIKIRIKTGKKEEHRPLGTLLLLILLKGVYN